MKALIAIGVIVLLLVATNGRTPLELIGIALLILIFGGAALVIVKLVQMLLPKP